VKRSLIGLCEAYYNLSIKIKELKAISSFHFHHGLFSIRKITTLDLNIFDFVFAEEVLVRLSGEGFSPPNLTVYEGQVSELYWCFTVFRDHGEQELFSVKNMCYDHLVA